MKLLIQNLSTIEINRKTKVPKPPELRVRFSVTLAEDDGEPYLQIDGWTIDTNRMIRPPYTRTGMSYQYVTYHHPSTKCFDEIRAAVLSIPDVEEILGPPPEDSKKPTSGKRILGQVVVKEDV